MAFFLSQVITAKLRITNMKEASLSDPDIIKGLEMLAESVETDFLHVTNCSHLVYATSVFDSFLSDITHFLILINPESICDSVSISYKELLKSKNANDIINAAIESKVRTVSYESFQNRIKFLKRTFGLKFNITESEWKSLNDFSTIRNNVTHVQSYYKLYFDSNFTLKGNQVPIDEHHNNVNEELIKAAFELYEKIGQTLFKTVAEDVLHIDNTTQRRVRKRDTERN
jgi:hypothetical protein